MLTNDVIALNSAAPSDIVTSLPGSPIDGQVIYYNADATNGVVWQLRYRSASASAYKWEFVGGNELSAIVLTKQTSLTTNTYSDLTTVGPTVTAPLAGDYVITWSSQIGALVGASNFIGVGVSVAAVDPGTYDYGTSLLSVGQVPINTAIVVTTSELKTGIAASSAVKMRYRNNQGVGYAFYANRYISICPIRVG